jgi:hypothetical protein
MKLWQSWNTMGLSKEKRETPSVKPPEPLRKKRDIVDEAQRRADAATSTLEQNPTRQVPY